MAYTFDGTNKRIILSSGTALINLSDLWSRYKDWVLTNNAGYLPAFDTVGGESIDLSEGTKVPLFLFIKNGWRIRPQEADHTLSIAGGTLVVDGGGDPFINTVGNFNVRIKYSQPVVAIGYSVSGTQGTVDAEYIATLVRNALLNDLNTLEVAILTRHPANQVIPADVTKVRGQDLQGAGTKLNPWRPV
jgi:hypothetical protein